MKAAEATESCKLSIIYEYVKEYFTSVNLLGHYILLNIRLLTGYGIY